jgi:hypothetical protein
VPSGMSRDSNRAIAFSPINLCITSILKPEESNKNFHYFQVLAIQMKLADI